MSACGPKHPDPNSRTIDRMYRTETPQPVLVVFIPPWLIGLDRSTGEKAFEHKLNGQSTLLVEDDRVFAFMTSSRTLRVFSYPTGEEIFESKLPGDYFSAPTITLHNNTIFVAMGGEITALRAGDGQVLWHSALKGRGISPATLAGPGWKAEPRE